MASPSVFDQALDLIARMHGKPQPMNVDFRGDALTSKEQYRRARVKEEDRPVEPSPVQADDLVMAGGVAKAGLKMAGRKVAERLAPVAEKKAGSWVLNKAEMGLDAFDRALVTKQNEFAAARGAKASAVDPTALKNELAEAAPKSGRQDVTR